MISFLDVLANKLTNQAEFSVINAKVCIVHKDAIILETKLFNVIRSGPTLVFGSKSSCLVLTLVQERCYI